jgi:hypothetical protein
MRWRFLDLNQRQDAATRAEINGKIDAWWREFEDKTDRLRALFSSQARWDLPAWMHMHLGAIHPRLMWEFGPATSGQGHRLVITPESAHHLRPLAATILERAPDISGWEFYGHRLPEDVPQTEATVRGRTGYDIHDFKVRVTRGEHRRVDVSYFSPSAPVKDDPKSLEAAFVVTETLLGEECLDRWIGAIEICPSPNESLLGSFFRKRESELPRLLPLDRLKETVDAVINSMTEQLPPLPHYKWIECTEWTLWKLKPEHREDYPEQSDLLVGKSVNPEMWSAAHSNALLYSDRFSRCGEVFCYVKLDGTQRLDEEKFADKAEIEDALDEVLKPNKLGCHIGGGTGLRYSYIDLALVDANRGIEAVRNRLQAGNVPKRSWIQFFDTDLCAEWIGVYDDSPPPPMPDFDG